MPLLIDLNFHSNTETTDVREIIRKQEPALLFSKYMENSISFLKHAQINECINFENVEYTFFKKRNGLFSFPIKTIYYLRKHQPKIVLVQGFVFPIQLLLLRAFL